MTETTTKPEPTIVAPAAPYSPDPKAGPEVDRNINRAGYTDQVEPYADEYPIDAKIEPQASQLNTRNQTSVLEPYIPQPYDPDIVTEPTDPPVSDMAAADAQRRKTIREFVKDHVETEEKLRQKTDPNYGKTPPEQPPSPTHTAASKPPASK